MKNLYKIKYKLISVSLLWLMFSSIIFGKEITNEKIKYTSTKNLSKTISSEFLSEIIEIPIKNPEPFIAIGFNATQRVNDNSTFFYIRVSEDKKNWSNWHLVEDDNHTKQNDQKYFGTLSFFEKNNKFMQFKTNAFSKLKDLTFSYISPGKTSPKQIEENIVQSQLMKTLDDVERPAYINRKGWNCPQDENVSSRSLTNVTHLIIHHSAGQTVSSDYAAVVRSYWDYHVNSNGWSDIGYNWLVDPNGVLYKGRAWKSSTQENVQGAHNSGKNGNTVGICFIGHYVSNIPSEAGLYKVAGISAFLCDKYSIEPLGESYHSAISKTNDNIDGHGQSGGGTACPGTQIINRMQFIREQTYAIRWNSATAPEVVLTYPATELDSAYLTKKIFIEFSHPMNKSSVDSAFSIVPSVQGIKSWSTEGNIFYFEPSTPLTKQTNYSITVLKTATSLWDLPLVDDIIYNFITKANDNLSLVSNFPKDGDVDIATDVNVELQFDGPIDGSSLSSKILFLDVDSNQVNLSVNQSGYANGIIKFKSRDPLNENSTYSIHVKEGITTTDNYIFELNKIIYFTTGIATSLNTVNIPAVFKLEQNYPNPFNPSTTIKYSIPVIESQNIASVQLRIYDILGREVSTVVNEVQASGIYNVSFDASSLSSGVYCYRLKAGNYLASKKMILLR
ncbi:MAG: T9SS type A sorting domain-containing protein [Ignavibacteriae bacterium]|nr:T9SS type A sorting domain-containing protein [Ignavibacteriota bacterium]